MFAKNYSLPLVDMYDLYKQILAGKYYTDDGLRPTAIGSTVIANETIKVINSHFKTRIPLIRVG